MAAFVMTAATKISFVYLIPQLAAFILSPSLAWFFVYLAGFSVIESFCDNPGNANNKKHVGPLYKLMRLQSKGLFVRKKRDLLSFFTTSFLSKVIINLIIFSVCYEITWFLSLFNYGEFGVLLGIIFILLISLELNNL